LFITLLTLHPMLYVFRDIFSLEHFTTFRSAQIE